MTGRAWLSLIGVSVVLLLLALWIHPARSHDHSRPELTPWFNSLQNKGKALCCTNNDGSVVEDPDWETRHGHYRVRIDGEWHDVPDDAVVTVPNRAGRTMVWPTRGWGGLTIRCFMPGSMG